MTEQLQMNFSEQPEEITTTQQEDLLIQSYLEYAKEQNESEKQSFKEGRKKGYIEGFREGCQYSDTGGTYEEEMFNYEEGEELTFPNENEEDEY